MRNNVYRLLLGLTMVLCSNCGDSKDKDCVPGEEGCRCFNGVSCNFGLTCEDDVCVVDEGSSDTTPWDSDTGGNDSETATNVVDSETVDSDSEEEDGGVDGGEVDGGSLSDAEACHKDVEGWDAAFATVEEAFLGLVNNKRSDGVTCGGVSYPPVPVLTMQNNMRCGDRFYVFDINERNYDPFKEPDKLALCALGATSGERAISAGFKGNPLGGGVRFVEQKDPEGAQYFLDQFLAQTEQCQRLMNSDAIYMGVGYAQYAISGSLTRSLLSYSIGKN